MELNVLERLLLLNLLPKEGSFTNLKLIRVVREELSFTEEEHKLLQFKQTGDKLVWLEGAISNKEVEIGKVTCELIVKALKALDEREGLTEGHVSLYEKFVEVK